MEIKIVKEKNMDHNNWLEINGLGLMKIWKWTQ